MEYNIGTIELLSILDENPTFRGINNFGHTLFVRKESKEIIHRKIKNADRKQKHVSLNDKWRLVKPIEYEKANELFKNFRVIEMRFEDGTKRIFRKMPYNNNPIIESGIPKVPNALYYCLTYNEEE